MGGVAGGLKILWQGRSLRRHGDEEEGCVRGEKGGSLVQGE